MGLLVQDPWELLANSIILSAPPFSFSNEESPPNPSQWTLHLLFFHLLYTSFITVLLGKLLEGTQRGNAFWREGGSEMSVLGAQFNFVYSLVCFQCRTLGCSEVTRATFDLMTSILRTLCEEAAEPCLSSARMSTRFGRGCCPPCLLEPLSLAQQTGPHPAQC